MTGRRSRSAHQSRTVPLREREHRLQQADRRIADRELRRVHADGDPAGAGVAVVPRQRHLPALVEPALGR